MLGVSGLGVLEGCPMTVFLSYLGHGLFSQDTRLILEVPVPGMVLETHLPSTGRSSCRPCIHSTQWLVKNESILWQVLFARQQGGRGGEKAQLIEPKDAGQRPCWQAEWSVFRLATSQHRSGLVKITAVGLRWSSYHSLSKRLAFLPPFLFSCV